MTRKTQQLSSIEQDILSNIQSGSGITDAFAVNPSLPTSNNKKIST